MKINTQWCHESELEIPFHDVDLLEVAWHGHYTKYFEIARTHLMESIGYSYTEMRASGFAWPIIDLQIRYVSPALLGEKVRVTSWIAEYESKLKIGYLMTDLTGTRRIAKGYTVQVAVDWLKREMHFVSPEILFKKLGINKNNRSN